MSTVFVLDCSVTLPWFFADEFSPEAQRVFNALNTGASAWVPSLWHLEVANGLVLAQRKARIRKEDVDSAFIQLNTLNINTDGETVSRAWTATRQLAERYKLTLYDAAYLEVAMRRKIPLATFDNALLAAAKTAGVASWI